MPKVYDCILFYNELDLLELHLAELENVVDYFVIVEGSETFAKQPKPMFYLENKERYARWADKIIHVVVDDLPDTGNRWDCERHSFNASMRGLVDADDEDIVIIAPVDEIPRAEAVENYLTLLNSSDQWADEVLCFEQVFYWYYVNCEVVSHENPWAGPPIGPKCLIEAFTPDGVIRRRQMGMGRIPNGGWHFSYLGGPEGIRQKLESFSHSEFDTDEYKDPEKLRQHLEDGTDILGRGAQFKFVELDDTFPQYLLDHQERFESHIRRLQ